MKSIQNYTVRNFTCLTQLYTIIQYKALHNFTQFYNIAQDFTKKTSQAYTIHYTNKKLKQYSKTLLNSTKLYAALQHFRQLDITNQNFTKLYNTL